MLEKVTIYKYELEEMQHGKKKGGTSTAITLAEMNNIPVINLAVEKFPYHKFTD